MTATLRPATRDPELERKKNLLYTVSSDCQHCGKHMEREDVELIEEARPGTHLTNAYLVHAHCSGAALCELLRRSMIGRRKGLRIL